jgi:hypothetical protein
VAAATGSSKPVEASASGHIASRVSELGRVPFVSLLAGAVAGSSVVGVDASGEGATDDSVGGVDDCAVARSLVATVSLSSLSALMKINAATRPAVITATPTINGHLVDDAPPLAPLPVSLIVVVGVPQHTRDSIGFVEVIDDHDLPAEQQGVTGHVVGRSRRALDEQRREPTFSDRSRRRLAPGDGERVLAEGLTELRNLLSATVLPLEEFLLGDHRPESLDRTRFVTGAGLDGPHREMPSVEMPGVEVVVDGCDLAGIAAERDQPGTTRDGLPCDLGGDRFGIALVDALGSPLMAGLIPTMVTMCLHMVSLDGADFIDDRVVHAEQVGTEVVDQRGEYRRPVGEFVDRREQSGAVTHVGRGGDRAVTQPAVGGSVGVRRQQHRRRAWG